MEWDNADKKDIERYINRKAIFLNHINRILI